MIEISTREGTRQLRGREPETTHMLAVDLGGESVFLPMDWPFEDKLVDRILPDGSRRVALTAQRFERIVAIVRGVAERRAELEKPGRLSAKGVMEEIQAPADKALAELGGIATEAEELRAGAEVALRSLALPGADSPFGAELRAALRGIKDSGERLKAFDELEPHDQAAILAGPPLLSGLPAAFHRRHRETALATVPEAAEQRKLIEHAEHLTATATHAVEMVNKIAGRAVHPRPEARPS